MDEKKKTKVKRTIRTGVRMYQPGEPIDWAKAY